MKKWYRTLGLKSKVVLSMTCIIILYSLIFSFVSIRNAKKEVNLQLEASHMEVTNQFNNYIDNLQSYLLDLSATPYISNTFINIMANRETGEKKTSETYLHDYLFSTILSKNNISFAGVVNNTNLKKGYYITTDTSFGLNSYPQLLQSEFFKDFISNDLDYGCYPLPTSDTSILQNNMQDKILYLRTIKDFQNSFNLLGYLLLGINTNTFDNQCKSVINTQTSGLLMMAEDGSKLYTYGKSLDIKEELSPDSNPVQYQIIDNQKYLVCTSTANSLGWKISYYTDLTLLPGPSISSTITYIILIAIAAITVFVLMASLITSAVTSPMKKLLLSIQHFQDGDFNQQVEVKNNDEIGQLTQGYNQMVGHIKDLIQQNYEIQIQEQKAQLAALQTQINPHFLYNTLDLLYWKSISYDQEEIAGLVYSLSKLFRTSLNKGNAFITYQNEEEFLSCYLTLQRSLMSERLSYELLVPESIKNTYLPRFILQPLIENAIVHGLDGDIAHPTLKISMSEHENAITIKIEDNGKGMTPKTRDALLCTTDLFSSPDVKGYAVPNILKRLQIYFGDQMSFEIDTRENMGTTITLTLPITSSLQEDQKDV